MFAYLPKYKCYLLKINLFTPNPPNGGSKLIFFTPFRDGANEENQSHNFRYVHG